MPSVSSQNYLNFESGNASNVLPGKIDLLIEAMTSIIESIVQHHVNGSTSSSNTRTRAPSFNDQPATNYGSSIKFGPRFRHGERSKTITVADPESGLLQALNAFVKEKVHCYYQHNNYDPIETTADLDNDDEKAMPSDYQIVTVEHRLDPVLFTIQASAPLIRHHHTELPSTILELLHEKVFSVMPIRLIAVDTRGCHLELIEKNEVFRRCASNIQACDFTDLTMAQTRRVVERNTGYAILSHTWIRDISGDVIYKDWNKRHLNKQGYKKIANFCRIAARNHNYNLAWIDTVCINKDSSSELDESIRSMYKWYRNAAVCITHLAKTSVMAEMHKDPWFTRGWTLQELLAPYKVEFYNANWDNMVRYNGVWSSEAYNQTLVQIEQATTITAEELQKCRTGKLDLIPISRQMQLAAERQVAREEDAAYSLMGILGVDISIAYGEGAQKSLFRLVRELLITKKCFMDIFNCALLSSKHTWIDRPSSLIPSDLKHYLWRSSMFDTDNYEEDTAYHNRTLDQFQPIEPIILTHLGIRIPLLLVPALSISGPSVVDKDSPSAYSVTPLGYPSFGDLYGRANLQYTSCPFPPNIPYSLLHREIFTRGNLWHSIQSHTKRATFGVFNFRMYNNTIVLPTYCISIPLNCGDKFGDVDPSDPISVIPESSATVFQLKSRTKRNRIPRSELAKHGLQLVTIYL